MKIPIRHSISLSFSLRSSTIFKNSVYAIKLWVKIGRRASAVCECVVDRERTNRDSNESENDEIEDKVWDDSGNFTRNHKRDNSHYRLRHSKITINSFSYSFGERNQTYCAPLREWPFSFRQNNFFSLFRGRF
jgi:hypothetical protein